MQTIRENSRFRKSWDLLILALVPASCLLVAYQFAFRHSPDVFGSIVIYLIDLFFVADITFNFRTSYRHLGTEICEQNQIRQRYLRTAFAIDLAAVLPFDLLLLPLAEFSPGGISIVLSLRLLRLLRVSRLVIIFRRWERQSWTNSGFLRILELACVITLLSHFIACAWFAVPFMEGFPVDSWVAVEGIQDAGPGSQYIRSLYWTIVTMTTVGYGDITPNRNVEYLLTMLVMLLGASMYAFIIGNIASLLSNLDSAKVSFWSRVEAASQYLRKREAPAELNQQVRNYFEYVWSRYRGTSEQELFADLPGPLRLDILLHLTREILEKVPLFGHCSAALRNELILALKPEVYPPGGFIVREGEKGNAIYFLSVGTVRITSDLGRKEHGTLGSGDYFGDLSMLFNERRTGSVCAVTYCDVFVLTRERFERMKAEYEEFRDVMKTISSEKSERLSALVIDGIIL